MANRLLNQFRFSYEGMVVEIWGQVAIGASGAPTLSAANSKGVASIARNSAGKYTITLTDAFTRLMDFQAQFLINGIPAAPVSNIVSNTIASGGKVIVVQFSDVAGAAADPANGEVLLFRIALKNSSV